MKPSSTCYLVSPDAIAFKTVMGVWRAPSWADCRLVARSSASDERSDGSTLTETRWEISVG